MKKKNIWLQLDFFQLFFFAILILFTMVVVSYVKVSVKQQKIYYSWSCLFIFKGMNSEFDHSFYILAVVISLRWISELRKMS